MKRRGLRVQTKLPRGRKASLADGNAGEFFHWAFPPAPGVASMVDGVGGRATDGRVGADSGFIRGNVFCAITARTSASVTRAWLRIFSSRRNVLVWACWITVA